MKADSTSRPQTGTNSPGEIPTLSAQQWGGIHWTQLLHSNLHTPIKPGLGVEETNIMTQQRAEHSVWHTEGARSLLILVHIFQSEGLSEPHNFL